MRMTDDPRMTLLRASLRPCRVKWFFFAALRVVNVESKTCDKITDGDTTNTGGGCFLYCFANNALGLLSSLMQ